MGDVEATHDLHARFIAGCGLGLIAAATLWPRPARPELSASTPLWCLVCGDAGLADVLLNLALFVPMGLGLGLGNRRIGRILAAAFLVTLTVESLQFVVIPGRDPSLSDVITNSTGGLAGGLLGRSWRAVLFPAVGVAQRLATSAAAAAGLVLVLTGRLLTPSLPAGPWYVQWAPDLDNYAPFLGTVLEARVNGHDLPGGRRLDHASDLRQSMLREGVSVSVRVSAGPPTRGLAPVVSIVDERQRRILLLGQDGRALRFEVMSASQRVRLKTVGAILPAAFLADPGQETRLYASFSRGRYKLAVSNPTDSVQATLSVSPAAGWALLRPFDWPLGEATRGLSLLWIALLPLPAGYWATTVWEAGKRSATSGALALLVVSLIMARLAGGLPPVGGSEWAGLLVGFAAGTILNRFVRGRVAG